MAPKHLSAVLIAACAVTAVMLVLTVPLVTGDPDMLQDFCVADHKSLDGPLRLNGFPCKKPETVTANDFFSNVLSLPGNTGGPVGSAVSEANVEKLPGLNTLGVSMSRVDYAPWGANPPHTHPRATEILFVLEGSIDVGFVTTSGKLFARTVCKGELFVFPRGLVHFQRNNGGAPAVAISAFNSQLPGTQSLSVATFQIDGSVVEAINSMLPPKY